MIRNTICFVSENWFLWQTEELNFKFHINLLFYLLINYNLIVWIWTRVLYPGRNISKTKGPLHWKLCEHLAIPVLCNSLNENTKQNIKFWNLFNHLSHYYIVSERNKSFEKYFTFRLNYSFAWNQRWNSIILFCWNILTPIPLYSVLSIR